MKTGKDMTNLEIAELLRDVAAGYELQDAAKHKFQIIAYQRAADAVEHATSELKDLWDDRKLEEVPGIGPSMAQHLDELFKTGKSKHFANVMKGIPPEAFRLMELPGIGIKTAMKMLKEGKSTEVAEKLKEVEKLESRAKRHLLPYAVAIADEIIAWMKKDGNTKEAYPLGSIRREAATVGDIDIAVASLDPVKSIDHFSKYPKKQKIIEKGTATASILLPGEVQVDLMVQSPESFGALLQHFTGSKHHNIALREYALKKGLSLNEYGISKIKDPNKRKTKFKTEEEFYNFLGLDWIPPELREDTGEIEASKDKKLPELVALKDVKGDFQIHSSFDIETSHDLGVDSMEEIIKKANLLNYEYLAFTEHNTSRSKHTDNEIVEILKKKREKVDQLNYSIKRQGSSSVKKVFNSLEIDIMPDGSLPVPIQGLETLDYALASIHGSFQLDRNKMTKRVLTALAYPKVKIFAHPTARKLNEREGVELNWPEIFEFCLKNHKFLEINADPMRLDLPDTLVREAVKLGIKFSFGTDAHSLKGMDNMRFGVSVARRGWCTNGDIINCLNLANIEEVIIK